MDRCPDCGALIEHYAHDEIGLCIVALATYVHREPSLAAPILPNILRAVAKIAQQFFYPWQSERLVEKKKLTICPALHISSVSPRYKETWLCYYMQ